MSEQVNSKKWVDYTDQDSSDDQHQQTNQKDTSITPNIPVPQLPKQQKKTYRPSKMEIDNELDKLDQLDDDRFDEVWLLMSSQDVDYLEKEANYLRSKAKKGGNIVSVYPSKLPNTYDVRVYITIAYDYISKGYDKSDLMKVTVSDRNFIRKDQSKTRGKKTNDYKEGEKKKYVDKETGLQAPPKIKKEESNSLENDRMYSKQEAERKGQELGNFRNKYSKKEREQTKAADIKTTQTVKEEQKNIKQQVKEEVKQVKEEPKEQVKVKQEVKQQPESKQKDPKKSKAQKKKSKVASTKFKSQNRFEGIQDLD